MRRRRSKVARGCAAQMREIAWLALYQSRHEGSFIRKDENGYAAAGRTPVAALPIFPSG